MRRRDRLGVVWQIRTGAMLFAGLGVLLILGCVWVPAASGQNFDITYHKRPLVDNVNVFDPLSDCNWQGAPGATITSPADSLAQTTEGV